MDLTVKHVMCRLALVSALLAVPLSPALASPAAAAPSVLSVASDGGGLLVSLAAPEPISVPVEADGERYVSVSAAGLVAVGEVGAPSLPAVSAWVVVPGEAKPVLTLTSVAEEAVPLASPPAPVPTWQASSGGKGGSYAYEADATVYGGSGLYPESLCSITGDTWVREWRLVQLSCHPYRWDRDAGALRYAAEAELRLDYGVAAPAQADRLAEASAGADVLSDLVANPGDLAGFRQAAEASIGAAALPAVYGRYRLMTSAGDGLYVVTYERLIGAGAAVSGVASTTFKLYRAGQEVAIEVVDSDGSFGPGDQIVFYGEERQSAYGTDNAYWLDWGGAAGSRVASRALPSGGGSAPVYLMAAAKMRSYDPRYPDPWRSTWTDVFLYEAAYSSTADDGHFYAGSIMVRGAADMPDKEWFAVEVPGAAGQTGTLQLTFESLTSGAHYVDAWFGVVARGGPYVSFVPGVLQGGSVNSSVAAQDTDEPAYTSLGKLSWTGKGAVPYELDVPSGFGLHVLKLQLAGQPDGSGGYLPERAYLPTPVLWYPVGYAPDGAVVAKGQAGSASYTLGGLRTASARLWDVSDAANPVALSGYSLTAGAGMWTMTFSDTQATAATYAVADGAGLKDVSDVAAAHPVELLPAAQYLIVCHEDLLGAAQALAAYRQTTGFSTRVVTTQEIYDRYSFGLLDPEAIRSFVYGDAYPGWVSGGTHTLQYLLLLGDGSFDFENRLNHGLANYVPPYLVEDLDTPDWDGQAGTDHRFANGDRALPSVYVGRLPARSAAEAAAAVSKIVAYEELGAASWADEALFAADDPDTSQTPALDFAGMADDAANAMVGDGLISAGDVTRVYQSSSANPPDGFYYSGGEQDTAALIAAWRSGQGVAYYTGHSDFSGWAHPTLINVDHVAQLGGAPTPILLAMTCFTGSFYQAAEDSLDEALLKVSNGGIIGSISPLTTASISGHELMQTWIFRKVYQRGTLGEAMLAGKSALDNGNGDLIDTYAILGDPALRLLGVAPAVTGYKVMLPVVADGLAG